MNLLDENVRDDQRTLLRRWRIPFRQIGRETSRFGIQDPDLLPVLHGLKQPTLFTQDRGFFKHKNCHRRYCLVWLDVSNIEVAMYIRRFLKHPAFSTHSKRMGKVVRVRPLKLTFWQVDKTELHSIGWLPGITRKS